MEVVASLSQGRTAAAQCGLFTHKSVPVIFEPPCICVCIVRRPTASLLYSCFYLFISITVEVFINCALSFFMGIGVAC